MESVEISEKPAKKVYQKHKIDGKISMVHYVNQNLKPQKYTSDVYPIYLRITIKRQTTNVKSLLSILNLSKSEFENHSNDLVIEEIKKQEILGIEKFLKEINAFAKEDFEVKEISSIHKVIYKLTDKLFRSIYVEDLKRIVAEYITKLGIENEIQDLFTSLNLDINDFIEQKREPLASILSKFIPDFKLDSVDKKSLLDLIKMNKSLYEVLLDSTGKKE